MCVWQSETMKEDRRRDNRYNKVTILLPELQTCNVNVHGGRMWSSAKMGYVVSWYGRVVDVRSWTFDEGSWRRSSCGDTARCLMLVSWDRSRCGMQLDGHSRKPKSVVGKSMSWFWHFIGLIRGMSIWLLAHNSGSLHGLVVAMLEQSVTASRYVDWMRHCRSVVVGRSISRFLTVRWVNRGCVDQVANP